jgi:hypothetical protein
MEPATTTQRSKTAQSEIVMSIAVKGGVDLNGAPETD